MYKHVTLKNLVLMECRSAYRLIVMAQHRFGVIFVEQMNLIWAVIINPCNYSSIKKER